MQIGRLDIQGQECLIPAVAIIPQDPVGATVIAHGYGGCKEEQLGLAFRVATSGLATYCIDMRGHGQHPLPLDKDVIQDIEGAIGHARQHGKVVAIGHSLGGRLSLISSADFAIGISPPLDPTYSPKTQELLHKLRSHRVRARRPDVVFEALSSIPACKDLDDGRTLIIYGSRDVPEIVRSGDLVRSSGGNAVRIEGAIHADTFVIEGTFAAVARQLERWFGIGGA